jgi:hypothetical protein
MGEKVTIAALQSMKRGEEKIVGVVAWDFQIAKIADRAGVDIVSVGDSVGMNLWGRKDPQDMTLDEMILVGKAVRGAIEFGVSRTGCAGTHGVLCRMLDNLPFECENERLFGLAFLEWNEWICRGYAVPVLGLHAH